MAFLQRVLIVGLMCCCARGARAQDAPGPAKDLYAEVARAPGDANVVLALDGGAAIRDTPAGRTARLILQGTLGLDQTGRSWMKLAAQLDLTPEEAFDRLLGTRLVFVERFGPRGEASWAMRSSIDRATDDLLRARLKPAPRKIEKGLTILSIEHGAFWLAAISTGDRADILLGPSDAPGLFDEMAASMAADARASRARRVPGGAGRLGDRPFFADVRGLGGTPNALLVVRWGEAAPPQEEGWLACAIRPHPGAIDAGFIATFGERRGEWPDAAWSRRAFDELSRDAFFAMMELDVPIRSEWKPWRAIADQLPKLPPEIAGGGNDRGLAGARRFSAIFPGEGFVVSPLFALETTDTTRLAAAGDRFIGEMLEWLRARVEPRQPGADPPAQAQRDNELAPAGPRPMMDFEGEFPDALRTVDMTPRLGALASILAPAAASGAVDGAVLAWTYRRGGAVAPDHDAGWWTVGCGEKLVEHAAQILARCGNSAREGADIPLAERPLPWVSLGVVRPAALVSMIQKRGVSVPADANPLLRAAKTIPILRWEAMRGPKDSVIGFATVEIAPEWKREHAAPAK